MINIYRNIAPVDILAIGIHPDDVELSASGTLLSHMAQGYKAAICDLTQGELGSRGTIDTRRQEAQEASEILGIDWRVNLGMADGFSTIDQEHILQIAEVIRVARPKIILANALDDRHPDHPRGANLVREAFFFSGLKRITSIKGEPFRADALYHYIQDLQMTPDLCVDITDHVEQKMQSILAYKTQFYQVQGEQTDATQTPISSKSFMDYMYAKMRVFGRPLGVEYAEGYNVHRTPGVQDLLGLI